MKRPTLQGNPYEYIYITLEMPRFSNIYKYVVSSECSRSVMWES